ATLAATAIGLLAGRHPHPPAATWLDWLTTTPLATTGAGAGMWLIQFGYTNTAPGTAALRVPGIYLGAALLATATALTLPVPLAYQVLATAPLALTAAILTTGHATGTLAALYTLTVTGHHLTRATQLALTDKRRPTTD